MRLDRSAGVVGQIPAEMLEAIFAIDGRATTAAVAAVVAAARGLDADELEAALRPVLLDLYASGMLEVVERG